MILLRRYLTGFGPARVTDAANWAGLAASDVQQAADGLRLRRFRDEEGRALVDLPRAPLPGGATGTGPFPADLGRDAPRSCARDADPAGAFPAARLRHQDSALHAHVPGRRRCRRQVERRGDQEEGDTLLEPFERMPAPAKRQLRAEAERLVRFVEPDATSHTVRGG